jgi:uncharacterized protein (TIGR00255 family)
MVHSMTSFARHSLNSSAGQLTWEIRTVNSRYLEPHFRLPDNLRELEPALRDAIRQHFSRGKVECFLKLQGDNSPQAISINTERLSELASALIDIRTVIPDANSPDSLTLLAWPGILQNTGNQQPQLLEQALEGFRQCLTTAQQTRAREGSELAELIRQRLHAMASLVEEIQAHLPDALAAQRQQLQNRLADMLAGATPNSANPDRLEQEMVILAQKADVAEELDRLRTHMNEVQRILKRNEPIGRRLDFMMQELNREANTLSSKALTTITTQASVEMKVLIEQMREQVQNIE